MLSAPMLVLIAALAADPDLTSERRGDVELASDLRQSQRNEVFDIHRTTEQHALALLERLEVPRRNRRGVTLRVFKHESDYDDFRRRTHDRSTMVSDGSYYRRDELEVVLAWKDGSAEARGQLRRQSARHVLLQHATDPAIWIEEGFAGYFQGFTADPYGDPMKVVDDEFLAAVRRAIDSDAYCPLETLVDLRAVEFYGLAGAKQSPWSRHTLYAQSWSLFLFLLESDEPAARTFLRMAAERLATGRWDQARTKDVLGEIEPLWKDFVARDDLGRLGDRVESAWAAIARGEPGAALDEAKRALALEPEHRSALHAFAIAACAAGEHGAGADAYERLLERREDHELRLALARCRLDAARADPQTAELLHRAIEDGRKASAEAPPGRAHDGLIVAADAAELSGNAGLALDLVREIQRLRGIPSDLATELLERERRLVKLAIGK